MRAYALSSMVASAALLVGCTGDGTVRINSTLADSVALSAAEQIGGMIQLETPAGPLTIERSRIAVSEVELEGEEEGDEEFEMGKRVVEVALSGQSTEIVAQSVTAGTYQVLGLELMLSGGSGGAEFADFAGDPPTSILVDGSYLETTFTYRSTISPELEFTLGEPAVVPEGGEASIAVTFDVAAWFLGPDGTALDPTDGANRGIIEDNILNSMAAFAEIELSDDD